MPALIILFTISSIIQMQFYIPLAHATNILWTVNTENILAVKKLFVQDLSEADL